MIFTREIVRKQGCFVKEGKLYIILFRNWNIRKQQCSCRSTRISINDVSLLGRMKKFNFSYRNACIILILLVITALFRNIYNGLEDSTFSKFIEALLEADKRTVISVVLPPRTVSRIAYMLSTIEKPMFLKKILVKSFSKMAEIDLSDYERESLDSYKNIQDLFTRELKKGLRNSDSSAELVSPCDGSVVNCGVIDDRNFIFEYIKSHPISLSKLYNSTDFPKIKKGSKLCYVILYLAPYNYHRFHSPTNWNVEHIERIKGLKKSVSVSYLKMLPGYACRNERVILEGTWKNGYFSMIPIGAMNVGGIIISNIKGYDNIPSEKWNFQRIVNANIHFQKNAELGRFLVGSSIVLVFEAPEDFEFSIKVEQKVKYGDKL